MNLSAPFIRRRSRRRCSRSGLALSGILASAAAGRALPQVDFPTIQVSAGLPGADPRHDGDVGRGAARAAVRPHRRRDGDDVDELPRLDVDRPQFDLDRNIDGAARDVQAAINAARGYLRRRCRRTRATGR
jgi:multidrug efflux pump